MSFQFLTRTYHHRLALVDSGIVLVDVGNLESVFDESVFPLPRLHRPPHLEWLVDRLDFLSTQFVDDASFILEPVVADVVDEVVDEDVVVFVVDVVVGDLVEEVVVHGEGDAAAFELDVGLGTSARSTSDVLRGRNALDEPLEPGSVHEMYGLEYPQSNTGRKNK